MRRLFIKILLATMVLATATAAPVAQFGQSYTAVLTQGETFDTREAIVLKGSVCQPVVSYVRYFWHVTSASDSDIVELAFRQPPSRWIFVDAEANNIDYIDLYAGSPCGDRIVAYAYEATGAVRVDISVGEPT